MNRVIPFGKETRAAVGGVNSRGGNLSLSIVRPFFSWPAPSAEPAPRPAGPSKQAAVLQYGDPRTRADSKTQKMPFILIPSFLVQARRRVSCRPFWRFLGHYIGHRPI